MLIYSSKSNPNYIESEIVKLLPKLIIRGLSPVNYRILYFIGLEGLNFTIIKLESYCNVSLPLAEKSTNS